MTASPAGRERRYRRLLWAYPGPYRRRHGAEIVTTLLEMDESGYGRPSAAQALHLVACGLRQRFRLPAGRPLAAVAAVLATIALGALGAAGGTWLGWQTATPVPSSGEMRALTTAMGADPPEVRVLPWQTAMNGPVMGSIANGLVSSSAERVRTALVTAGWRVTAFTETEGQLVDLTDRSADVPTRSFYFRATKDGLSLAGAGMIVVGDTGPGVDGQAFLRLDVWAVDTAAVRPCTIAGVLLGALAGWLLAAALADRARHRGPAHRTAVAVLGVTAFAAAVIPAFDCYRNLYQVLSYDSGNPNPYIMLQPSDQLPAGLVPACTGIGFLALAAAFLIAGRGARGPEYTGIVSVGRT